MGDQYTIREIIPSLWSDDDWRKAFAFLTLIKERYRAIFPSGSWEEYKNATTSLLATEKGYAQATWWLGEELAGNAGIFVFNMGTPRQFARINFNSLHEEIPGNLAALWAGWLADQMDDKKAPEALFVSFDERTTRIMRAWQAKEMSRQDEYLLYREKSNQRLMGSWLEQIPAANPSIRHCFYEEIPEEYLEEFARLFTAGLREMPQEGQETMVFQADAEGLRRQAIWRKENNIPMRNGLLFDEAGRMVGLTYAIAHGEKPKEIHQAMTTIIPEYRGRGLAKWLKAAMYFRLSEDFPSWETIMTTMRTINEPIQHINAMMGYVLARRGFEFKVTVQMLRKFAADNI